MVRVPAAFAAEHQALPPATISVLVPRTKRSPRVDASSTPIPEPAAIEDDATVTSATVPATMTGDHLNNARTVSLLPNQAPIQDQLSPVADTEADTKVDAEADAPRSMSRASTPGLSDPKTPPRKTPPRKSAVTVMPPPHTPRSALSTRPLMVPWTTGHAVVAARPATPRSVRINMDLTSVVRTHSPREYDRSPLPDITKNQRSARKISDRHWRNLVRSVDRFKAREMAVHPDSRGNTRLYLGPVSPPSATSSEGSNEFDLFADPRKNDEDDEDEDQVAQPASPLRGKKGTAAGASVLGSATKPSPSNHVAAAAPPHTPPSQVVLNSDEDENEEEDENRAGSPDITPTARSVSSRTSLLPLESPGLSALLPPRKVLGYLPPLPPAQPKFTAETHPVSIPIVAVAAAATENTEPVAATPLPATPSKLFSKSPVTVTPGSASRILSSMFRSVGTVISRMSSSSSRHSGSDD
ncbi:hypothetical protein BC828DRAFT_390423 [Blastocladiella britannica]|nr:hypothetical protein BC828DRAFT_390423 [Blastocladiella britannica]